MLKNEGLKDWISELCNTVDGGLDIDRTFQGDGDAPMDISRDGIDSGVPVRAFTDVTVMTAQQLYQFYLYNVKAQKDAGHHLTSEDVRTKEAERARLMNQITRVTSGNFFFFSILFLQLTSVLPLPFPSYRFTSTPA